MNKNARPWRCGRLSLFVKACAPSLPRSGGEGWGVETLRFPSPRRAGAREQEDTSILTRVVKKVSCALDVCPEFFGCAGFANAVS